VQINTHHINNIQIAEIIQLSDLPLQLDELINTLGSVYFMGINKMIIYQKNLPQAFFDLKTGFAGELLQKFSNYNMQLAIVGNFNNLDSKSLNDFIFESNKMRRVNFVSSFNQALNLLSQNE